MWVQINFSLELKHCQTQYLQGEKNLWEFHRQKSSTTPIIWLDYSFL